jgi:hypothetical protein
MRLITNVAVLNSIAGGSQALDCESNANYEGNWGGYGGGYDGGGYGYGGNIDPVPDFTIFGTPVYVTGSAQEGIEIATKDCVSGAAVSALGNHFATVINSTPLTSSAAVVVGCTIGVGRGLLRDMLR